MTDISGQYDSFGKQYKEAQVADCWPRETWARKVIDDYVGSYERKVVIDAGCGDGLDTLRLVEKGAVSVLAFDPSELMLEQGRRTYQSEAIEFKQGIFEAIPFGDGCADVMVGLFSLHYVADLDAAYTEIFRTLKSGGKLALSCSHPVAMTLQKQSPFKGQEVITMLIYDEAVALKKPTHTMEEYLSTYFLSHFNLEQLQECYDADVDGHVLRDPKVLFIGATKK